MTAPTDKLQTRREHMVNAPDARTARGDVAYQVKEYGRKVVACRRVDPGDQSRGYVVTTEER